MSANFVEGRLTVKALKVKQPIGEFFVAVIPGKDLASIAWVDVRRMSPGEVDTYLGIQRKISPARVGELRDYVRTADATFPTSIVVAVPGRCAQWNEAANELVLSSYSSDENPEQDVSFEDIAKVLDGQHRLRGFAQNLDGQFEFDLSADKPFDLNVAIFVDADLPQQANIFATVNLAQTKVNKSLVYDLASLSASRSPQKSAHYVAVALDSAEGSPFYKNIKRLGVATPDRGDFFESLTQATFVEALLKYITNKPLQDRDFFISNPGAALPMPSEDESRRFIFRKQFVAQREADIAKIVWAFFDAVRQRWPEAWDDESRGNIIRRTNGFRAFMAFLRPAYLALLAEREVGTFVSRSEFLSLLKNVRLESHEFTSEVFPPGTSGESRLKKRLMTVFGDAIPS